MCIPSLICVPREQKGGLQRIRQAVSANPDNEELAGVLVDLSLIEGVPDAAERSSRQFRVAPDSAGPVLVESNRLKYAYVLRMQGDTLRAHTSGGRSRKKRP